MTDKIDILVVDDHPLFRQGVVHSLQMVADFNLVGETSSGEEALAMACKLLPDARRGASQHDRSRFQVREQQHEVVSVKSTNEIGRVHVVVVVFPSFLHRGDCCLSVCVCVCQDAITHTHTHTGKISQVVRVSRMD